MNTFIYLFIIIHTILLFSGFKKKKKTLPVTSKKIKKKIENFEKLPLYVPIEQMKYLIYKIWA